MKTNTVKMDEDLITTQEHISAIGDAFMKQAILCIEINSKKRNLGTLNTACEEVIEDENDRVHMSNLITDLYQGDPITAALDFVQYANESKKLYHEIGAVIDAYGEDSAKRMLADKITNFSRSLVNKLKFQQISEVQYVS